MVPAWIRPTYWGEHGLGPGGMRNIQVRPDFKIISQNPSNPVDLPTPFSVHSQKEMGNWVCMNWKLSLLWFFLCDWIFFPWSFRLGFRGEMEERGGRISRGPLTYLPHPLALAQELQARDEQLLLQQRRCNIRDCFHLLKRKKAKGYETVNPYFSYLGNALGSLLLNPS